MQIIPLTDLPQQEFNTVLDGQSCTISLSWRQTRLYLSLTVDQHLVCQGALCQNKANILQGPRLNFSGSLHFFDLLGDLPPACPGLHSRWFLVYLAADETLPASLEF